MSAAPAEHSGIASAVNNTVARAASLFAVAVLPLAAGLTGAAALSSAGLASGFRTAMYLSAAASALGGLLAFLTIRNPRRAPKEEEPVSTFHCALAGTPLAPILEPAGQTST
jgi:hypothetical protein